MDRASLLQRMGVWELNLAWFLIEFYSQSFGRALNGNYLNVGTTRVESSGKKKGNENEQQRANPWL